MSCLTGVECIIECIIESAIKFKDNFNFVSTEYCNWIMTTTTTTTTTTTNPLVSRNKKCFSPRYKTQGKRTRGCKQWEVESFCCVNECNTVTANCRYSGR
jgi:hypothetical protein